jgi:ATP-dependent RNA helicase DHX8/PRP22
MVSACVQVIATNQVVYIHPSSVLSGGGGQRKPDCIVFNELVKTSKPYARVVASIEPQWLPELCPALFARVVQAPHVM